MRTGLYRIFKIEIRDDIAPRAINLVGIESPGLTAAVPIARHAISLMEEREKLTPNPGFNPVRKGIPHFAEMTKEEQEEMIRQNPDYGQVICRCEKVTRAETPPWQPSIIHWELTPWQASNTGPAP